MPDGTRSHILEVSINGAKLKGDDALLLTEAWVDFAPGVPAAFQLTFRDEHRDALKRVKAELGAKVVLTSVSGSARTPLLTGEVTGLETEYEGGGSFSVVRGYDLCHRLTRQRQVVGHQKQKASQIVRKLVSAAKIPIGKIGPTKVAYPHIAQAGVTDWDFICRLADENNMVMYTDAKGKFFFEEAKPASSAPAESAPLAPADNPLELRGGKEVKRCRSSVTAADQYPNVEVRGWSVTTKKELIGKAPASKADPGAKIGVAPKDALKGFKPEPLVRTDTPFDTQKQVSEAAKALAADVTGAFAELEVSVHGEPKLRPGVAVTLADVGQPFEGKYTVTGARHLYASGSGYETWVSVTGGQWRSVYGLASGGSTGSELPSVANAVVTDVGDPQDRGRVKVRFPWLDSKYTSDWVRTVQFGGLKGGGVLTPSVNDEVLVVFDRGRLDHPYIIGGLYNGKDKPHRGKVKYRDRAGRIVRLTLADRDNNRLDLLNQKTPPLQRGVRLSTGNDRLVVNLDRTKTEITVDSRGAVSITGGTNVSVGATGNLSLSAGGSVSVRAGAALTLNAGARIQATAPTTGITGTGNVNISGATTTVNSLGLLTLNGVGPTTVSSGTTVKLTAPAVAGNVIPVL